MTNFSDVETGSHKLVITVVCLVDGALRSCFEVPRMNYPHVGVIVHYVARGSADGVFKPICRAAIIAEVPVNVLPPAENYSHEISSDDTIADLVVLNPSGMFFNRCVHDDERRAGTWHTLSYCES